MRTSQDVDGPFPFNRADLEAGDLDAGARHTLAHYRRWSERNPDLVSEHVARYTRHLRDLASPTPRPRRHRLLPGRSHRAAPEPALEVDYFAVYNLGEVPTPERRAAIVDTLAAGRPDLSWAFPGPATPARPADVLDSLVRHLPPLRRVPETRWLGERLTRLHRVLPEEVVRAGGMGKVIRAMAGVLAIGVYDTWDDGPSVRNDHLARIVPGAYALGAAYVIVDDTLQDLPGGYVPPADRRWCDRAIRRALSTGVPIDDTEGPDHPLVEELRDLYALLLDSHPFAEFPHLYRAAEAMYLAQHRDALRTPQEARAGGVESLYPDILVKAGMSRVVANILGRRTPRDGCYARCLNTIFLGQLKDDLRDREEDAGAGRVTPFTCPPEATGGSPLHDLFAYDAYVVSELFGGDPTVAEALSHFGAVKLANCLAPDPRGVEDLLRDHEVTPEMALCLRTASGVPGGGLPGREPLDTRIKNHCASVLTRRDARSVDARTFVADRLPYINDVIRRHMPGPEATGLHRIVAYAMDAPGKRLRPALGLMLAAELGVDERALEPFVVASELFHTASLLFDDLPAQDDAALRRGRPTAHTVFDEASVQLAAISMISTGFGLLTRLTERYPASRVTEVIAYAGSVLGPERLCRGQELDLHMKRTRTPPAGQDILEMYALKTSTAIEAALVPLMMLEDRPAPQVELVRGYAHHAGIVFQIRDDVLDLVSSADDLGKDTDNDVDKVNVVRVYGLREAQRLIQLHLEQAVDSCARLPFDTRLLEGMVTHFARRRR